MSLSVPQLAQALQTLLTVDANDAARETGFVKRQRKFSGATFVQTLVFTWLHHPDASLEDLAETALELGVEITPSSIDERFTSQAADCLATVLEQAVDYALAARPAAIPLLRRFAGVYLQDSSTIALPAVLADLLPGCGGSTAADGAAALKVQVRWEVTGCALEGLTLHPGRAADTKAFLSRAFLPPGALRLTDLGYFDLGALQEYDGQGVYYLTRLAARTKVFDACGRMWSLGEFLAAQQSDQIDVAVKVGVGAQLSCRLVAERVPEEVAAKRRQRLQKQASKKGRKVSAERLALCAWTVYITNAPVGLLSLREALVLGRLRWQIELLFKLWKSEGGVNRSRGHRRYRVLCEVYAKLLALVVQHWVLLTAGPLLGRSALKAARRVRRQALQLARALGVRRRLQRVLAQLQRRLRRGCRVKHRRRNPTTFQLLLDPKHESIAVKNP